MCKLSLELAFQSDASQLGCVEFMPLPCRSSSTVLLRPKGGANDMRMTECHAVTIYTRSLRSARPRSIAAVRLAALLIAVWLSGRSITLAQTATSSTAGTGIVVSNTAAHSVSVDELKRTAEAGNASAQAELGFLYATGQGLAQDYGESMKWYRMAAKQGDWVATLGQAIKLRPNDPEAWFGLGAVSVVQDKYDDAVAAYRQAIKLKPDDPYAWYAIGGAYAGQHKYDDAIAACRKAVSFKAAFPEAWYMLGAAYGEQHKYDEAIAAYHQAIKLKPVFPDAWYAIGGTYGIHGQYADAEAAFRQAVKLRPDYAPAWFGLGVACDNQGKPDDAVTAYREAIKLKPDDPYAWFYLGRVYEAQGKQSEARDALDHLRKLDPSLADKLAGLLSSK